MSPALTRSSAIQRFEGSNAFEIHNGITFDFYTGLPHVELAKLVFAAYLSGLRSRWMML